MSVLLVPLLCDSDHNAQQEIFWILDHDVWVKMAAAFAGVKASLSLISSSSTLQHKGGSTVCSSKLSDVGLRTFLVLQVS